VIGRRSAESGDTSLYPLRKHRSDRRTLASSLLSRFTSLDSSYQRERESHLVADIALSALRSAFYLSRATLHFKSDSVCSCRATAWVSSVGWCLRCRQRCPPLWPIAPSACLAPTRRSHSKLGVPFSVWLPHCYMSAACSGARQRYSYFACPPSCAFHVSSL
jgi:hypothetical protein